MSSKKAGSGPEIDSGSGLGPGIYVKSNQMKCILSKPEQVVCHWRVSRDLVLCFSDKQAEKDLKAGNGNVEFADVVTQGQSNRSSFCGINEGVLFWHRGNNRQMVTWASAILKYRVARSLMKVVWTLEADSAMKNCYWIEIVRRGNSVVGRINSRNNRTWRIVVEFPFTKSLVVNCLNSGILSDAKANCWGPDQSSREKRQPSIQLRRSVVYYNCIGFICISLRVYDSYFVCI